MASLTDLLIGALCVWRLTHLLHAEDGPNAILARLREAAGAGWLGQALGCFYCASLLVAAPIAWVVASNFLACLLLWPALSGAACLLEATSQPPPFPGLMLEDPTLHKE
jgi:hypothetical protein